MTIARNTAPSALRRRDGAVSEQPESNGLRLEQMAERIIPPLLDRIPDRVIHGVERLGTAAIHFALRVEHALETVGDICEILLDSEDQPQRPQNPQV